jgi:TetR/AcrR family transcriptional regulator, ethionamide resistance regulator
MPKTTSNPVPRPEMLARLSDAAEKLLADSTYAEIRIDDLIEETGLGKTTFYAHFDGKAALLNLLAERVISDLTGFEGSWWTLPPGSSWEQIREALRRMVAEYRSHGRVVRAVTDAAIYDAEIRAKFQELVSGVVSDTARHLREGQRTGVVPADLDAEHTAFALTWMLERGFSLLLYPADEAELERSLEAAAEIIWHTSRGGSG